ncbi:hypothetical protein EGW08_004174 [Elysia chlorotica]|uniref:Fibrinogen C-terminal domain-containing protein n=1 Tax=Elysia chlorotica TaxID=188477 RepID=A0A3S1BP00_ELYCH|nr:hypothetical protein EGW08_004174 [Elysia chlorotica]
MGFLPVMCFGHKIAIQRRTYGNVSFNRTYSEYMEGFGTYAGDFFLGLRNIHKLTAAGRAELEIVVNDNGRVLKLHVKGFVVASEEYKFHYKFGGTPRGSLSSDAFIRSSLAPGFPPTIGTTTNCQDSIVPKTIKELGGTLIVAGQICLVRGGIQKSECFGTMESSLVGYCKI